MTDTTTAAQSFGGERKRLDPFVQGMKEGVIKEGVNMVSDKFSLPMAEALNKKLQELHPNMAFTAPMVQSAMQAIIILGMAEVIDIAGPNIPGDMAGKASLGAKFMRKHAGEKVGADLVESMIHFLPMIMTAFSDVSEGDLMDVVIDHEMDALVEEDSMEYASTIEDLFLDEEADDELFNAEEEEPDIEPEPIVAPVKKRTRKKRVRKT